MRFSPQDPTLIKRTVNSDNSNLRSLSSRSVNLYVVFLSLWLWRTLQITLTIRQIALAFVTELGVKLVPVARIAVWTWKSVLDLEWTHATIFRYPISRTTDCAILYFRWTTCWHAWTQRGLKRWRWCDDSTQPESTVAFDGHCFYFVHFYYFLVLKFKMELRLKIEVLFIHVICT